MATHIIAQIMEKSYPRGSSLPPTTFFFSPSLVSMIIVGEKIPAERNLIFIFCEL